MTQSDAIASGSEPGTPAHGLTSSQPTALKAGGAVQMVADLTRMERSVWSMLVFNAYAELLNHEVDWHSIPIGVLARFVGHTSRNTARLREILERLQTTLVRFNYLGSDQKNAWSSVQLAGRIRVENGTIYYRFDKDLRKELADSGLLAKLDLESYRKFTSAHAMVLYENTALYRDQGSTPMFPVEQWRALMNATGPATSTPGRFLERVIRPAIEEVNTVTDIRVEAVYETTKTGEKGGRPSISSIAFLVKPAPEAALNATAADASTESSTQAEPLRESVVGSSVRGYAEHPLVARLTKLGMHLLSGVRLLEEQGEEYAGLLLELYELQQHKVKSAPAWISAMSKRLRTCDELRDVIRQSPRPLPMGGAPSKAASSAAQATIERAGQGAAIGPGNSHEAPDPDAAAFSARLARTEAAFNALDPIDRSAATERFLEWVKDNNPLIYRFATQAARSGDDAMNAPIYRVAFLQFLEAQAPASSDRPDPSSTGPLPG